LTDPESIEVYFTGDTKVNDLLAGMADSVAANRVTLEPGEESGWIRVDSPDEELSAFFMPYGGRPGTLLVVTASDSALATNIDSLTEEQVEDHPSVKLRFKTSVYGSIHGASFSADGSLIMVEADSYGAYSPPVGIDPDSLVERTGNLATSSDDYDEPSSLWVLPISNDLQWFDAEGFSSQRGKVAGFNKGVFNSKGEFLTSVTMLKAIISDFPDAAGTDILEQIVGNTDWELERKFVDYVWLEGDKLRVLALRFGATHAAEVWEFPEGNIISQFGKPGFRSDVLTSADNVLTELGGALSSDGSLAMVFPLASDAAATEEYPPLLTGFFDVESGDSLGTFDAKAVGSSARGVSPYWLFSPDGATAIQSSFEAVDVATYSRIVRVPSGEVILEGGITSAAWSPDGTMVYLSREGDSSLYAHEVATGKMKRVYRDMVDPFRAPQYPIVRTIELSPERYSIAGLVFDANLHTAITRFPILSVFLPVYSQRIFGSDSLPENMAMQLAKAILAQKAEPVE